MEFNTYVKVSSGINIYEIKQFLYEMIRKSMEKCSDLEKNRKQLLLRAVEDSGGSCLASRYGLEKTVIFADSELVNAYERGNDAVKYLQYRYDFKYYPMNNQLREFPLVVAVEASGKCNLRCAMCFQSNMDIQDIPQNKQVMTWNTYQKFLNELDNYTLYSIVFASRGEPLLNPNIGRMIHAAKLKGVLDIKLNTNATLLTADMSRSLLASGLDLLVFSVDSVDPEHYRQIRGVDLDLVLNNINQFMDIKRKEFSDSMMKVRVAMVLTDKMKAFKEEEVRRAQEYWSGRVDELSIKTENDFISIYEDGQEDIVQSVCSLLWERVYLWNDGSVNPCDIDHLSSMYLGNLNDGETIAGIWRGPKMEKLRNEHLENRKCIKTVCRNCRGY